MNKKMLRNIIVVAGIIILLTVGIILIMRMENVDAPNEEPAMEQYTLYSIDIDDVQSVSILGEPEINVTKNGDLWALNGVTDDVDQSKLAVFVSTASKVMSQNRIETNCGDMSQYGIEKPSVLVKVTQKDGVEKILRIGDKSPVIGEYFIAEQDSKDVYTLNAYKYDTLTAPVSYYYQFNRFNVNVNDITNIKLERLGGYTIELRMKENKGDGRYSSVWEMIQPYPETYNAIDNAVDDMILTPISELSVTERAPENILYGFESPYAVMTVKVEEYRQDGTRGTPVEIRLDIGNSENGLTYVQLNGKAYSVSSDKLDFISTDEFLLVSKLAGFVDILDTDGVIVKCADSEMRMQIVDHDSNNCFKVNERVVDTEAARKIYQEMIGFSVDAVYNGEQIGDKRITLDYHGFGGAPDVNITLSSVNEIYDAVTRNGITRFLIKKTKTDNLMKAISDYKNNL